MIYKARSPKSKSVMQNGEKIGLRKFLFTVREASVFRHNGSPIKGPLKPPNTIEYCDGLWDGFSFKGMVKMVSGRTPWCRETLVCRVIFVVFPGGSGGYC